MAEAVPEADAGEVPQYEMSQQILEQAGASEGEGGVIPLILTILSRGTIDHSPECRRPWTVDFRNPRRYPGRGKTLVGALRHYFFGRAK